MHAHEADESLFQTLEQMGVDFNKTREINFYFVFPTELNASSAQSLLKEKDFDSDRFKLGVPWWKRLFVNPNWAVSVTRNMTIDRKRIKDLTTLFEGIAGKCGGKYDGWEANVMDENIDASNLR